MCKKSSTFAAILSRDGGIGRHEGLKILWPVMAVRVQVPLAVQSQKEVLNIKMLSTFFCFVHRRKRKLGLGNTKIALEYGEK